MQTDYRELFRKKYDNHHPIYPNAKTKKTRKDRLESIKLRLMAVALRCYRAIAFWKKEPLKNKTHVSLRNQNARWVKHRQHQRALQRKNDAATKRWAPINIRATSSTLSVKDIPDPALESMRKDVLLSLNTTLDIVKEEYFLKGDILKYLDEWKKTALDIPDHIISVLKAFVEADREEFEPLLATLRLNTDDKTNESLKESIKKIVKFLTEDITDWNAIQDLCQKHASQKEETLLRWFQHDQQNLFILDWFVQENLKIQDYEHSFDKLLFILLEQKVMRFKLELKESENLNKLPEYLADSVIRPNANSIADSIFRRAADLILNFEYPNILDNVAETLGQHIDTMVQEKDAYKETQDMRLFAHDMAKKLLSIFLPSDGSTAPIKALYDQICMPVEIHSANNYLLEIASYFIDAKELNEFKEILIDVKNLGEGIAIEWLETWLQNTLAEKIYDLMFRYSQTSTLHVLIGKTILPFLNGMLLNILVQDLLHYQPDIVTKELLEYSQTYSEDTKKSIRAKLFDKVWKQLDGNEKVLSGMHIKERDLIVASRDLFSGLFEKIEANSIIFDDEQHALKFLQEELKPADKINDNSTVPKDGGIYSQIIWKLVWDLAQWNPKTTLKIGLKVTEGYLQPFIENAVYPFRCSHRQLITIVHDIVKRKFSKKQDLEKLLLQNKPGKLAPQISLNNFAATSLNSLEPKIWRTAKLVGHIATTLTNRTNVALRISINSIRSTVLTNETKQITELVTNIFDKLFCNEEYNKRLQLKIAECFLRSLEKADTQSRI